MSRSFPPSPAVEVRLVVVSPSAVTRAGLVALLDRASGDGLTVIGEAAALAEVGVSGDPGAVEPPWDGLLLDGRPGEAEALVTAWPGGWVVILGPLDGVEAVAAAWADRPWGYLHRDAAPETLIAAVHAVRRGLQVIDPALATGSGAARAGPLASVEPFDLPVEELTPREREVLQLVAHGLPNKAIAARLRISEHTVKFHVAAILGKLGAASRADAVRLGARRGLVTL